MTPLTRLLIVSSAAFFFVGCASDMAAAWRSFRLSTSDKYINTEKLVLNPDYRYLRVMVNGVESALLVLGYELRRADGNTVQVWYSAQAETLQLMQGHIVGSAGLPTNWVRASYTHLADFQGIILKARISPVEFVLTRDEMPGYRYGVQAKGVFVAVPAPKSVAALVGVLPSRLRWFEERYEQASGLQTARFAVDSSEASNEVVFGEQCLADDLCIAWQTWPVKAAH